jgi:hypothetical protein
MFENQIRILHEPELRHVLAHLSQAIEAVAMGQPLLAQAELASIEGLVFYEDESQAEAILLARQEGQDGDQGQMHETEGTEAETTPEGEVGEKRGPQLPPDGPGGSPR